MTLSTVADDTVFFRASRLGLDTCLAATVAIVDVDGVDDVHVVILGGDAIGRGYIMIGPPSHPLLPGDEIA